jgi:hypothetical protein
MLGLTELQTLSDLAFFYGKPNSLIRRFVGLTTGADTRKRFRFVAEESSQLRALIESAQSQEREPGRGEVTLTLTPRSLVALWGRVLSSLNTPRARRKLSPEQIDQREVLASKLAGAAAQLARRQPEIVAREIETRRTVEREWMREALASVSGA